MASMALSMRFMKTCCNCTRSALILGSSPASSDRMAMEYRIASPCSNLNISWTISFTSISSLCGGDFLYSDRIWLMISAARFPYLSILAAAARARSRLGGSCASHSMQLLALVMAAAMGCLISCAREACHFPQHGYSIDVCQIVLELTQSFALLFCTFAIFNVREGSVPFHNLSMLVPKW